MVNPQDAVTTKHNISKQADATLKQLLKDGATNAVIMNNLRAQHNTILSPQQISRYRHTMFDQYIKTFTHKQTPFVSLSSINKLLLLMTNIPTISFVYMTHTQTNALVTYNQEMKRAVSFHNYDIEKDINSWRKELKIHAEEEILVSFAWCHDEEKRKFVMFPEFICVDMTFGVNKERRNLVTCVGIDGNCEIYTGCRCWMPSKQQFAYDWVMSYAIPTLIGRKTTYRTKVISSDAEIALVKAITSNINKPSGPFVNAKFRYDYYHLVKQPWNKFIGTCHVNPSPRFLQTTSTIAGVIMSWFNYTETENEFQTSYKKLLTFLDANRSALGSIFYHNCKSLLTNISSVKEHCTYHEFLDRCNFGYMGSSIVESMNVNIKRRDFASLASMSIDKSTHQQVLQVEHQRD